MKTWLLRILGGLLGLLLLLFSWLQERKQKLAQRLAAIEETAP